MASTARQEYEKQRLELIEKAKILFETTLLTNKQIGDIAGFTKSNISKLSIKHKWVRSNTAKLSAPEHKIESKIEQPVQEPPKYDPLENRKFTKAVAENRQLKAERAQLEEMLEETNKALEIALALKEPTSYDIPKVNFNPSINHEAIPIIQFSDWHVEERVDKKMTRGLNEFNPDIARKRVDKLTENTLKLINKERQSVEIKSALIVIGGDMINSYLHEHDVIENYMSPLEAVLFAKELICKSLATIAEHGGLERIDVMCIRGNHPRLTKKMISSIDYKMNLEAMIYNTVKEDRKLNHSMFNWHIPESEFGYIEVGGKMIRNMHGHQVKFQGGLGGITIPLNKYIMRLDQTQKADYTTLHHWHSLKMISDCNTSINGSLVGFNSYAASCGFAYEPAQQAFQILDSKRGFTLRCPIFCD